ncbi:hypothetical protein KA529_00390 [Candidatus Saccharibacteria bacterium]|nr:hypothetical protein [Candidatus Saccharibacteria bacterium]
MNRVDTGRMDGDPTSAAGDTQKGPFGRVVEVAKKAGTLVLDSLPGEAPRSRDPDLASVATELDERTLADIAGVQKAINHTEALRNDPDAVLRILDEGFPIAAAMVRAGQEDAPNTEAPD